MRRVHPQLRKMVKPLLPRLCFILFCAFFSVLAILIAPLLIGEIIDRLADGIDGMMPLMIILAIVYIVGNFFLWLLTYTINRIAYQSVYELREKLYAHLSILPLNFYDQNARGDTMSRFVNDVDIVADGLLQGLLALFQGTLTIIGAIIFMMYLDIPMAFVVLLSAPLAYYVARWITIKSQEYFRQQANDLGNLNGYVEEMIEGQKIVQSFQQEQGTLDKFETLNQSLYTTGFKSQFISAMSNPSTRIVNNIFYALIGVIGSIRAIQGDISVGEISSFLIFATIFGKPFNDITSILTQVQSAFASAQRIFHLFDQNAEISDAHAIKEIKDVVGHVKFSQISFSYQQGISLIENLNLDIKAGSNVAIVGQTGAGKTTLVNLLMRFYDVNKGVISIDGIDIRDVTRDNLREQFGMVLQDTWLFHGSIKENIAYGKEGATMEEIIHAGKASGAHGFIQRLELGYDTIIQSDGDGISQGQRQLLTIASVMLANPPMLILDEATSNIDTYTEQKIQAAFQMLTKGRTSFVIAHRLSTIKNADIILVMEKGSVMESGNHQDLLKQDGYYAKLYHSQFSE